MLSGNGGRASTFRAPLLQQNILDSPNSRSAPQNGHVEFQTTGNGSRNPSATASHQGRLLACPCLACISICRLHWFVCSRALYSTSVHCKHILVRFRSLFRGILKV